MDQVPTSQALGRLKSYWREPELEYSNQNNMESLTLYYCNLALHMVMDCNNKVLVSASSSCKLVPGQCYLPDAITVPIMVLLDPGCWLDYNTHGDMIAK